MKTKKLWFSVFSTLVYFTYLNILINTTIIWYIPYTLSHFVYVARIIILEIYRILKSYKSACTKNINKFH